MRIKTALLGRQQQTIPFKANRKGYVLPDESPPLTPTRHTVVRPEALTPQAYRNSLEQFIDRCNLHDLIASARSDVAEAPIRQRIEAMDLDQIREHRVIWKHTFRGTHFLQLLQQRCRERGRQKDQTT